MPKKVIPANTMGKQHVTPAKKGPPPEDTAGMEAQAGEFGFFAENETPPPQPSEGDFGEPLKTMPPHLQHTTTEEQAEAFLAAQNKAAEKVKLNQNTTPEEHAAAGIAASDTAKQVAFADSLEAAAKDAQGAFVDQYQHTEVKEPKGKVQTMGFDFGEGVKATVSGTKQMTQEPKSDYVGDTADVVNKFAADGDITISQKGNAVTAGNSTEIEAEGGEIFQAEMVHIGIGKTINTGDYENVKININFSAYVGELTHLETADSLATAVKTQMEKLEAELVK